VVFTVMASLAPFESVLIYSYGMGMGFESSHEELPGMVAEGISEQNQLGFYQRWAEFMQTRSWTELSPNGQALSGCKGGPGKE
jgi:hypothetical protein